jgi:Ser/Thr protein kinase RdoA (MazF antagonist)
MTTQHFHLPYSAWSNVRQRRHLTELATTALTKHSIDVTSLRLVQHGFNATFRVEGSLAGCAGRWALRLGTQGLRSPAETAAEIAWLDALRDETEVEVAPVERSTAGEAMVSVPSEPLARDVVAVLFEWLPGRLVADEPPPAVIRRLGRLTAQLHAHAERWQLPTGTMLERIDDARMGLDDHLAQHPMLDSAQRSIVGEVAGRADETFSALRSRHGGHVIHGDLHPGNLMTTAGRLSVLDFDDCGISHPLHDLAITAYYLRPADLEGALRAGYEEIRPLPGHHRDEFELLVAARNLALLNDTVTVNAAWVHDLLPRYIPNTITKLRGYLDTGVFRHDVEGLLD